MRAPIDEACAVQGTMMASLDGNCDTDILLAL